MAKSKRNFNITVLFYTDPKTDRERLKGILRFTLQHPEWNVTLLPDHPANRRSGNLAKQECDGLITNEYTLTHYSNGDLSIWNGTKNLIIFDANSDKKFIPGARQINIDNDSAECGRYAAGYFLNRGLRSLGYVHMLMRRRWSEQREEGFRAEAEANGAACAVYADRQENLADHLSDEDDLARWIAELPKPCGILGANDTRAMQIVKICNRQGFSVPGEVAVMGVDNNKLATSFLRPTLTSIELENEQAGYLAAVTLHKMLNRRKLSAERLMYGNPRIIERDSTCDLKGTARIIAKAREFMAAYKTSDIKPSDIARAAGVSRRTLERRFTDAGSSPAEELRRMRLDEVCRLLKETTLPLAEIAEKSGFRTTLAAQNAFLRRFGVSMRKYRRRQRAPVIGQ